MNFTSTYPQVVNKTKNETRRIFGGDEWVTTNKSGITFLMKGNRVKYRTGKSYAVTPGRGKKATHRMVIQSIHTELLQDITNEGAIREGAKNYHDFWNIWDGLYGGDPVKGWDANPVVVVYRFALITGYQCPRNHNRNPMRYYEKGNYYQCVGCSGLFGRDDVHKNCEPVLQDYNI